MSNYDEFMSLTAEERLTEATEQIAKIDGDRVPVLIQGKPSIELFKFLTQGDLTVAQFMVKLRKQINVTLKRNNEPPFGPEQALWLFAMSKSASGRESGVLAMMTQSMGSLHEAYKHDDGFLHLRYDTENVFG